MRQYNKMSCGLINKRSNNYFSVINEQTNMTCTLFINFSLTTKYAPLLKFCISFAYRVSQRIFSDFELSLTNLTLFQLGCSDSEQN